MKINSQVKEELKKYLQTKLDDDKKNVEIVSPYPFGSEDIEMVKKEFPDIAHMEMHVTVDPSILAGIIIKIGTKMIDLSLRGELQSLKHTLYEIT